MSIYALSDLHGDKILFDEIQNFLKPDDTVIFLGDAADRGEDGWEIIKSILNDKRWIYLMGNHEDLLVKRLRRPESYDAANLHNMNGGAPTWEATQNDPDAHDIMIKLIQLPYSYSYTNKDGLKIYLSHSGAISDNLDDLIWDRGHFFTPVKYMTDKYDIIVHGHTPIPHLIKELNDFNKFYPNHKIIVPDESWDYGAYQYNGNKIDIDCCTIRTHAAVLVNLDTFDENVFRYYKEEE